MHTSFQYPASNRISKESTFLLQIGKAVNTNGRVEISIYRFTEWSGELFDVEHDVESKLGAFTWRVEGQSIPKAFNIIRKRATFHELADIDTLAIDIKSFMPIPAVIRNEEARRIAIQLIAKIANAMVAVKPGESLAYTHSTQHAELVERETRRAKMNALEPWERQLMGGTS